MAKRYNIYATSNRFVNDKEVQLEVLLQDDTKRRKSIPMRFVITNKDPGGTPWSNRRNRETIFELYVGGVRVWTKEV